MTKPKPQGYADLRHLDDIDDAIRQARRALSEIVNDCPGQQRSLQLLTIAALALAKATDTVSKMREIRK